MVGDPVIKNPDGYDYDILHMPAYRQPTHSSECICYALWIVSQYVANGYPDRRVRDKTNPPKLDQIKEHISIGELGWENVSQEPLTELSSTISSIKFNLEYRYNGIPQRVDEFSNKTLENLLPTIIWIDRMLLETGDRGTGSMHAAIVCGANNSHITIEDPLVEGTTTLEIEKLEEAWDPEFNTAIQVRLKDGLEPTQVNEI